VTLALDRQKLFIPMPLIALPGTAATELLGRLLAKLATPFAHRLIGHPDSTFTQEFFHIPQAQTEPKVQPHRVANNLHGKPVMLIASGWD
jgi:hypothetical protein